VIIFLSESVQFKHSQSSGFMSNAKSLLMGIVLLFCLIAITCAQGSAGSLPVNKTGTTVSDIDGNVYATVKIGNQIWMAENMRTTKYNDGTVIPNVADKTAWRKLTTPGYCYYNNTTNVDSIKKYGALYNYYTVDMKKLAPTGWHVPTNAEWDTLNNYLIAKGYNSDNTTTGSRVAKSMAAKTDWAADTTPWSIGNDLTKNNSAGFSALPGGCRDTSGVFHGIGSRGYWWGLWRSDPYTASRALFYDSDDIIFGVLSIPKGFGESVRLIKDN
jgi:uncharacterized protein (TIGR02145 family)